MVFNFSIMYTKTKKKQIHNLVTFYNNIAILEGTMKDFRHEKHHYEDADSAAMLTEELDKHLSCVEHYLVAPADIDVTISRGAKLLADAIGACFGLGHA